MLKRNLSKIAIILGVLCVISPVSAFAGASDTGAYDGDGTYLGNTEYDFTLTPVNTETATKDGSSKIKIIKGDAASITLTPKDTGTGFGSYTTDVARFANGLGRWLTVVLDTNGYGSFTVPAGWKEQDGYLCAVIGKGTTSIPTNNTNQIEFKDEVLFKFKVNFTEHHDNYGSNENDIIGWRQENGHWYYADTNGDDVTEWKEINGVWYYFWSDGTMAANTYIGSYYVNSSGAWLK